MGIPRSHAGPTPFGLLSTPSKFEEVIYFNFPDNRWEVRVKKRGDKRGEKLVK